MARDRRHPVARRAFLGINRHYRRFARRLRAGWGPSRGGPPTNRCSSRWTRSTSPPRARSGTRGRSRRPTRSAALHRPGRHTDSGIRRALVRLRRAAAARDPADERRPRALAARRGLEPAARRVATSSPSSCPSSSSVPRSSRRRGATSFRLKLRLLSEPGVVVTDVPAVSDRRGPEGRTPSHLAVRVLVANVHAGSLRALAYAQSLGVEDTRAVSFAFDGEEAAKVRARVDERRHPAAARPTRGAYRTSARRSSPTCGS